MIEANRAMNALNILRPFILLRYLINHLEETFCGSRHGGSRAHYIGKMLDGGKQEKHG